MHEGIRIEFAGHSSGRVASEAPLLQRFGKSVSAVQVGTLGLLTEKIIFRRHRRNLVRES